MAKKKGKTTESSQITGWQAIGKYLGQPVTVAQRWAKDGMPVQRKGRSMTAKPGPEGCSEQEVILAELNESPVRCDPVSSRDTTLFRQPHQPKPIQKP